MTRSRDYRRKELKKDKRLALASLKKKLPHLGKKELTALINAAEMKCTR